MTDPKTLRAHLNPHKDHLSESSKTELPILLLFISVEFGGRQFKVTMGRGEFGTMIEMHPNSSIGFEILALVPERAWG